MFKHRLDLSLAPAQPHLTTFSMRWLLLPVLAIGYYLLLTFPDQPDMKYMVLTGSSFTAGFLLLSRLARSVELAFPAWVILALFIVGYYVKFIWILLFSDAVLVNLPMAMQVSANHGSLVDAFEVATLAFLAFAISAWLILGRPWMRRPFVIAEDVNVARPLVAFDNFTRVNWILVPIAILISGVSGYLMYRYGIAVMGVPSEPLPFRLGGFIFYTRLILVPTLFLVSVQYALQARRLSQLILSLSLLVANGLLDMILRASRGALALNLVTLVLLLIIRSKRIRIWHAMMLAAGFVVIAVLHPVMTEYRFLRMVGAPNIMDPLLGSLTKVTTELSIWDLLKDGTGAIIMRVIGIEALIPIIGFDVQPLHAGAWEVLRSAGGVAGYYTMDVLGYPSDALTSFAPSLVGWFYLLGGTAFVVVGIACFTITALGCWKVLRAMTLTVAPVAQAMFLTILFEAATDGVLDQMGWTALAVVGSITAAEILTSFALKVPLKSPYRQRMGLEAVGRQ
jgi:hypothetical protein